jgi:hypothetical protein
MKQRFVLMIIAATALACSSAPKQQQPAEARPAARETATLDPGDYACSLGGYPEFLCRIEADGKFVSLEKLGGSERFRGSLVSAGEDIQWINAAANTDPAELVFKHQADGTWFAEIPSDGEKVGYRLRRLGALGSQFGGESYAGAIGPIPAH